MAQVNIDVAKEESVQAVNANVNSAVSNTAYSATASSTGTLSQKLAYIISTLIGATNATGGTTTAGTLMAKVNALLTSWTSARATAIDNINTNIAVNNTASKTGTVSQKESYSISLLENATYGLSAIKTALGSGGSIKSVQRGICDTYGSKNGSTDLIIDINAVNMDKSIIIVDGFNIVFGTSTSDTFYNAVGYFINSSQLAIKRNQVNSSYYIWGAVWQVIEFN